MRDIKFKAWDGDRMQNVLTLGLYEGFVSTNKTSSDVEEFVIIQYTGLKDRNGVEIYEGDIMRSYNEYGEAFEQLSVVEYDVPLARFKGIDIEYIDYEEVIGNIYENPDLMKK